MISNYKFDEIVHFECIHQAYEYLLFNVPRCCIVDYHLPDGTAYDLYTRLKRHFDFLPFPVIVSTGKGDERLVVEMMQLGVQDYLVKLNLTSNELIGAIRNAVKTLEIQFKLYQLAHFDPLTGLLNRALFMDRLDNIIKNSRRTKIEFSLIYLDLDKFKNINDTYGHAIGDLVLQNVADKIQLCTRESDSVGRLGGDEFVILLPNTKSYQAHYIVQKLLVTIPKPIQLNKGYLYIYPSLGLTSYTGREPPKTAAELLNQADNALYTAKSNGSNRYVKYSDSVGLHHKQRSRILSNIHSAIIDKTLNFEFQPIYSHKLGRFTAVEALLRWNLEDDAIPPQSILQAILDANLFIEFHDLLFESVMTQHKIWLLTAPDLKMNINLPAILVHEPRIVESLLQHVENFQICSSLIILEVTESSLMREPQKALAILSGLADKGFGVAIDDFGTGYSSLEYLSELPCQTLKIDRKFLNNVHLNSKKQAIVAAIISLAHQLGLTAVAEGVQSELELLYTHKVNCDFVQGYYIAKPEKGGQSWDSFLLQSQQKALML